ncbi:MAG: response regulator transcription factor [Pseudomonadota bacterium]
MMSFPHNESDVVLIVDDVPDNLALLCDSLDEAGYEVVVATDGNSALERVRHITPDAILLDAMMPGLNGFDTCRRIKTDKTCSDVPVIFMTALTETVSIIRGFDAGGVDYVTKPIDPNAVIARVASHIRSSRAINEARRAIDTAGQALIVFNRSGAAVWFSTRVHDFFKNNAHENIEMRLLERLSSWVLRHIAATDVGASESTPQIRIEAEASPVIARFVGAVGKGRYLCVLEIESGEQHVRALANRFGLTPRELDVLAWVSSGKTDRDIADILGMRPRTVNKHLEHIYVKLGVETRTAAAAMAQSARNRL